MGAVAGAFAAAATTPLDVIKTNMMCSAASRPTMLGAARSIAAEGSGAQFFRCAAPPARPSSSNDASVPQPPWQGGTDARARVATAAVGPEQRLTYGGLAPRSGVGPRALSNGINSAVFFCFFEALRGAIKRRQAEARHRPPWRLCPPLPLCALAPEGLPASAAAEHTVKPPCVLCRAAPWRPPRVTRRPRERAEAAAGSCAARRAGRPRAREHARGAAGGCERARAADRRGGAERRADGGGAAAARGRARAPVPPVQCVRGAA
jgi:hypothetical protein